MFDPYNLKACDKSRAILNALAATYGAELRDEDEHFSLTSMVPEGHRTIYVYHDGDEWRYDDRWGSGNPVWLACTIEEVEAFLQGAW